MCCFCSAKASVELAGIAAIGKVATKIHSVLRLHPSQGLIGAQSLLWRHAYGYIIPAIQTGLQRTSGRCCELCILLHAQISTATKLLALYWPVGRYDHAGCTDITNIDFSRTVIKEMMLKNLRQRPRMKWLVQDMTATKVLALSPPHPPVPAPSFKCHSAPPVLCFEPSCYNSITLTLTQTGCGGVSSFCWRARSSSGQSRAVWAR